MINLLLNPSSSALSFAHWEEFLDDGMDVDDAEADVQCEEWEDIEGENAGLYTLPPGEEANKAIYVHGRIGYKSTSIHGASSYHLPVDMVDEPSTNSTWKIVILDFYEYATHSFTHAADTTYTNETLAHHRFIGASPKKPIIAFSFQLFEVYCSTEILSSRTAQQDTACGGCLCALTPDDVDRFKDEVVNSHHNVPLGLSVKSIYQYFSIARNYTRCGSINSAQKSI
ncbi:hypothetical protein L208DRAFT_1382499 [Tricholoma matsutake]|nr:hypothetical protein L208DRAFT_1382499 [Tricholoma matsutake 945]